MTSRPEKSEHTEFEKFDTVMSKLLSVSKDELKRREREWKRKRARKKAKPMPKEGASSKKR
jgi:hypothetical protein